MYPPCCFKIGQVAIDITCANAPAVASLMALTTAPRDQLSPAQWAALIAAIAAAIAQILSGK